MESVDEILPALLEMGFQQSPALLASQCAPTLEAAVESSFQIELQRASACHPLRPLSSDDQKQNEATVIPPPSRNVEPVELDVPLSLDHPLQWLSLRMSTLDEYGNQVEGSGSIETKPIEFEVIFASATNPNHSLLESYTSDEFMRKFKNESPRSAHSSCTTTSMYYSNSNSPFVSPVQTPRQRKALPNAWDQQHDVGQTKEGVLNTLSIQDDAPLDSEGDECAICFDRVRNVVLLPCMHLCVCQACAFDYFTRIQLHNQLYMQSQLQQHNQQTAKLTRQIVRCPCCAKSADIALKLAHPSLNEEYSHSP